MELTKELLERIEGLLEPIKEHIISVELTGSSANPWVKSKNDLDIVFVLDKEENRLRVIRRFHELFAYPDLRAMGLDIHFVWLPYDYSAKSFAYESMFAQPLLGYPKAIERVDILKDTNKARIPIKGLLDFVRQKEKEKGLSIYLNKYWYHAYTEMCILKNNSYDLTEGQIERVNMLHDMKPEYNEARKETIDEMIKEIESWQI